MRLIPVMICLACLSASAAIAEEHRQLGVHQHGHGTLNIAIDGTKVSIDLDVPAADIVGFEHAARSKAERAAIESAKLQLSDPLALFVLPGAAGCTLKDARVTVEGDATTDYVPAANQNSSSHVNRDHDSGHSDFNGAYTLECREIAKLTSIGFRYFDAFNAAEALNVTVIGQNGQGTYDVMRANPHIRFPGLT
jgi:Protein of unknown function (DUF2796)